MKAALVIPSYIAWHYSTALREIWGISTNFVWFLYHFFSIPILLKTLVAPWHKLGEKYKKGFDPGALLSTFVINTILRVVGFVVRIVVIIFALFLIVSLVAVTLAFYVLWLAAPLVLVSLFLSSINYLSS